MSAWETVVGLEVHVQLATAEKLFCGCPTEFGAPPNANTCPVCLGLPGALPVLNPEAVRLALQLGVALECAPRRESVFARKQYFYPDLPKGYQISQFEAPILEGGGLDGVRLHRIHIEEDAGKSIHADSGDTLVDLNRAGIPLVEIVAEPDLRDAEAAADWLRTLHGIVRALRVSDGNLEQGSFRCDANVSVRRPGEPLGTRCELKNLNTFKGVQRAIAYEAARQIDLLEAGGRVAQETRLWDDDAGQSRSMRSKEEAHDYRYVPDPDLPPLRLSDADIEAARAALPELPAARRRRFVETLGLSEYDAEVLTAEPDLADWFEAAVEAHPTDPKAVSNWITSELLARVDAAEVAATPFAPAAVGRLLGLIADGTISGRIAKQVFEAMLKGEGEPEAIVEQRGLRQVTDEGAIEAAVRAVLDAHPAQVEQLRGGKTKVKGFFVGKVMQATRGKANPRLVNEVIDRLTSEEG